MRHIKKSFGIEYLQTLVYMKSKSFVMTMSFLETGQRKHSDFYTALSAMLGVDVVCASTGRPVRAKAVRGASFTVEYRRTLPGGTRGSSLPIVGKSDLQ